MLVVFEALVLPDRFDTFDGLVDLKLRGMPPGAAMAKDGFAVAADPAIDFPLASNRAWDGVTPSSDLLVGSPGCCLGHGLLSQLHLFLGDFGDLLRAPFLPYVFTTPVRLKI